MTLLPLPLRDFDPDAIDTAAIPAALVALAALQTRLAARLAMLPAPAAPSAAADDEMLSPEQAAELLKQPRRWLSRNARRLPFVKRISARRFVCSRSGILKWLATRKS